MKKYIKPVSKIVEVNSQELLAGSPDGLNGYQEGEGLGKKNNYDWEDEDY